MLCITASLRRNRRTVLAAGGRWEYGRPFCRYEPRKNAAKKRIDKRLAVLYNSLIFM